MIETDKGLLKDPVCGMTVTIRSPQATVHEGTPVHFCSAGCKTKFLADPGKYPLSSGSDHPTSAPALKPTTPGIIYTCPMHPQIPRSACIMVT
jgi:Cu+-exporting ATPase